MTYPTGVQIFLDDEDITYYLFGKNTLDTSIDNFTFRDIDITPYCHVPGVHVIEVRAVTGGGRVEIRAEIF